MVLILLKLNGDFQNQNNEINLMLNSYKEESGLRWRKAQTATRFSINKDFNITAQTGSFLF